LSQGYKDLGIKKVGVIFWLKGMWNLLILYFYGCLLNFLEISKNFDNVVAIIFESKIEILEIKTAGILKKIGLLKLII